MISAGSSGMKWWYEMWYNPPEPFKKSNSRFLYYRWQVPERLRAGVIAQAKP